MYLQIVLTCQAYPVSLNLSPMRFLFLICFLNENVLHMNTDSLLSSKTFLYKPASFDRFCQKESKEES